MNDWVCYKRTWFSRRRTRRFLWVLWILCAKISHADHADWRRFYSAWGEAKHLAFLRILRRLREKNMSFCLKSPVRSACNLFLTEEQKNIRLRDLYAFAWTTFTVCNREHESHELHESLRGVTLLNAYKLHESMRGDKANVETSYYGVSWMIGCVIREHKSHADGADWRRRMVKNSVLMS